MRNFVIVGGFLLVALIMVGASGYLYFQYYGQPRCEACGMIITSEMALNYNITDSDSGQRLYACCAGCTLRLVAAHPSIHIDALDSWYGTSAPIISINIINGQADSIAPLSTRILLGSKLTNSCVSNRIAINDSSVQLLIQNGYNATNPLSPFKTEVPNGVPVMNISAALTPLKAKGIAYVPPSMMFLAGIAIAGIAVLGLSLLTWRKLLITPTTKPK